MNTMVPLCYKCRAPSD